MAAAWCHLNKVDDGLAAVPVAEADFGGSLEGVFDLMNSPRAFTPGKFQFQVAGFPLFLRGKPGTLNQIVAALEKATVISGDGIAPLTVSANPLTPQTARVIFKNFLSSEFNGTIAGQRFSVPASGSSELSGASPSANTARYAARKPPRRTPSAASPTPPTAVTP